MFLRRKEESTMKKLFIASNEVAYLLNILQQPEL